MKDMTAVFIHYNNWRYANLQSPRRHQPSSIPFHRHVLIAFSSCCVSNNDGSG